MLTDFGDLFEKGNFSQDIILEPNDMLFIPDNFAKRISVVGAVNTPTSIPFREELTVLDVIITAGGLTEFAKENDVKILRKNDDNSIRELSVKAKDLMKKGNMEENIAMKPGDVVIVKETMF
jgi:polysaccharide export outer membrane protein